MSVHIEVILEKNSFDVLDLRLRKVLGSADAILKALDFGLRKKICSSIELRRETFLYNYIHTVLGL